MIDGLMNLVAARAGMADQSRARTRHGTITSYDPNAHAVKVALQPDGTLTGWLPLKSAWIGNGWGLHLAPSVGDAIEVEFQEANGGAGTAGWRFFNDADRPLPTPSGEAWLVHKSGASVKLTNDGRITLADPAGAVLALTNDGNVTITGNVVVSGSVMAQGDVKAGTISLHTHKHSAVQPGTGTSGLPQ